ncbi:16S rRNA (adenine(1518)-N(6)/adenine(1519)-N(6))-dimethyltransferase RsmA [Thermodesulfobacteriota bacterium]
MNSNIPFRPNKRLGQHFIKDQEIIHRIISLSGFKKSDHVLEVGPGRGALTIPLSRYVGHITAVEKDSRLVTFLQKTLPREDVRNVQIINEDILRFDLNLIPSITQKKIKVIGNLPYNISSPFIEKLIQNRDFVSSAVLMFQKEFAERLVASPGGKDYGALTVLIQYNAAISPLLDIPKEMFYPEPKVGSGLLSFDIEKPHSRRAENDAAFQMVVKGAFAHRRKTILNSLKGALTSFSSEELSMALEKCSVDQKRRAETVNIDEFLDLAEVLANVKGMKDRDFY